MFSSPFETLCDLCDLRYSIEYRKKIRTYYSCEVCEYKMADIILEDELKAGEITIDKWLLINSGDYTKHILTNKDNKLSRICDYLIIDNFNVSILLEDADIDLYHSCRWNDKYNVSKFNLDKLSKLYFHLPIPLLSGFDKFRLSYTQNSTLKTNMIEMQKKVNHIFMNANRCVLILRMAGKRTITNDDNSLLYIIPKEIIEAIIVNYFNNSLY